MLDAGCLILEIQSMKDMKTPASSIQNPASGNFPYIKNRTENVTLRYHIVKKVQQLKVKKRKNPPASACGAECQSR